MKIYFTGSPIRAENVCKEYCNPDKRYKIHLGDGVAICSCDVDTIPALSEDITILTEQEVIGLTDIRFPDFDGDLFVNGMRGPLGQ